MEGFVSHFCQAEAGTISYLWSLSSIFLRVEQSMSTAFDERRKYRIYLKKEQGKVMLSAALCDVWL